MGKWIEMTLSGSAGDLASVSLTNSLTRQNGGTGFGNGANFGVGDLLVGDSSNNLRQLAISAENGTVLKVDTSNATTKLQWEGDTSGGVSTVQSGNSLLTITNGTTTPALQMVDQAETVGSSSLMTGQNLADFMTARGITTATGTITGVNVATDALQDSLTFVGTGTTSRTITLGGSITDLTKDSMAASDRRVQVGNQFYNLGVTTGTTLTGMTGLNVTAGSKTLFDGVGANTLSIGGAGNVKIAGDLVVAGTASFENSNNLLVEDKIFVVGSGSNNNTGGFLVQQAEPVSGAIVGEFFGFRHSSGAGASNGRFGFVKNTNVTQIEDGSAVPDGTANKPWAAVVEVNTEGAIPSGDPVYGGSSAGQGNLYVDTSGGGTAYVYI